MGPPVYSVNLKTLQDHLHNGQFRSCPGKLSLTCEETGKVIFESFHLAGVKHVATKVTKAKTRHIYFTYEPLIVRVQCSGEREIKNIVTLADRCGLITAVAGSKDFVEATSNLLMRLPLRLNAIEPHFEVISFLVRCANQYFTFCQHLYFDFSQGLIKLWRAGEGLMAQYPAIEPPMSSNPVFELPSEEVLLRTMIRKDTKRK